MDLYCTYSYFSLNSFTQPNYFEIYLSHCIYQYSTFLPIQEYFSLCIWNSYINDCLGFFSVFSYYKQSSYESLWVTPQMDICFQERNSFLKWCVITRLWLPGSLRSFFIVLFCILEVISSRAKSRDSTYPRPPDAWLSYSGLLENLIGT